MNAHDLPARDEMLQAFLGGDATYEGVFVTAVRTTGIFCRPSCPARKPRPDNVVFFSTCEEALASGYRPCRRCRPLEPLGRAPSWLRPLLRAVEADPTRRWLDADLRALGHDPTRVRRWFKRHHGMTFHAYSRARRLGEALGRIHEGEGVARTAFDAGYDSLSGFNEAVRRFAGDAPTASKDARIVRITRIPTPLGPMVAAADDDGVCFLEFADRRALSAQIRRLNRRAPSVFVPGPNPVLERLATELEEYFAGVRHRFDVPVHPRGTAFQERVWEALREIPAGETRSYSEVARAIGRPRSVRAVARANGANPISILVPCHRVIGADGSLTGYGGGLWRKQRLLDLERDFGRSGEESPERHRDRAKNGDDPPRDRRPSHWLPE